MKRSTRTFVVERRNARKQRSWSDDALELTGVAAPVPLAAAKLFAAGQPAATRAVGEARSTARVLQDLRPATPCADQEAPQHDTVQPLARPRGRPRKLAKAIAAAAPAVKLLRPDVLEQMGQVETRPADVPVAGANAMFEIYAADTPIVAQVKQQLARMAGMSVADKRPSGSRSKKRLRQTSGR